MKVTAERIGLAFKPVEIKIVVYSEDELNALGALAEREAAKMQPAISQEHVSHIDSFLNQLYTAVERV